MTNAELRWLLAASAAGSAAYIFMTTAQLPDPLASHFALDGHANNHMPRDAYRALMTGLTLLIPAIVVVFQIWLPRVVTRLINLPRRDYWLATPERRAQMLAYLERHALITAIVPPLFFAGLHRLVMSANAQVPAQLDNVWFLLMGGAFVVCVIAAAVTMVLHFRRAAG